MLTLFHSPRSRSTRFLWLLEEIGPHYEIEYVTIQRADGSGGPDPKNPHPHKQVPALIHDEALITESAAIALYLTDAHPGAGVGPLVGDSPECWSPWFWPTPAVRPTSVMLRRIRPWMPG